MCPRIERIRRYKRDLEKYPHRLIVGSETFCSDAYRFYELAKHEPRLLGDFVWAGMSLYGLGLRASFKISDTIRDRGLQAPKDIVRFDNLLYGTDPRWQTLDVYRPKNAGGTALPVIVSVHGGGWVYGDTPTAHCSP